LSSHYGAASVQGFGEVGYRISTPVVTLEPFADLATINLHTNGFTEQGAAAALTTPSGTTNVTFTTLGVKGEKAYTLYGCKTTMRATLGWRHAFGDTTPLSTFAFAGGNAFTIAGVPIARDAASVDAGIDVALSRAATLGVSYSGQFARRSTDYGVQAKLTLAF
jgi:outer membrane autotransporter protein